MNSPVSARKLTVLAIVWLLTITLLHGAVNLHWFQKRAAGSAEMRMRIGFLPVTCHLTCPVTDFIHEIEALGKEAGILQGTAHFADYTDSFVHDESAIQPYAWEPMRTK